MDPATQSGGGLRPRSTDDDGSSATALAALDAATLAAATATSQLDHTGAARHLAAAIEALAAAGQAMTPAHFELAHALGQANWRAGRRAAAAAAFDEAWLIADALDDPMLLSRAALGGGFSCDFSGEAAAIRAARCREALGRLPAGDRPMRARLLADLAASLATERDLRPAQAAAGEAQEMARRCDSPVAIGYALVAEQFLNQGPARLARRIADGRETIAIAAGTGEHPLEILGRFCLIGALLEAGDESFEREIELQTAAVARLREPGYARHDLWFRCMCALLHGTLEEAEVLARQGLDAALAANDPDALAVYGAQVNVARWMQGRAAETTPMYDLMRREEPGNPLWPAVLAAVHAVNDQRDLAAATLTEIDVFAVPDDRHFLLTFAAIAEAAAATGDRAKIDAATEALEPFADRMVPIAMGVASWGPVARQLGLLARAGGDLPTAIAHFEAARDTAVRLSARPWIAWTELDLADAELDAGLRNATAAPRVEHAHLLATAVGMPQLVARATALRRRLP